eukprot:44316-Eustigmatos_ZCMA.PRE.1
MTIDLRYTHSLSSSGNALCVSSRQGIVASFQDQIKKLQEEVAGLKVRALVPRGCNIGPCPDRDCAFPRLRIKRRRTCKIKSRSSRKRLQG